MNMRDKKNNGWSLFIVYLWLLASTTKLIPFICQQSGISFDSFMTGNKLNHFFFGLLMLLGLPIVVERRRVIATIAGMNKPLLWLVGYALLSAFWSNYPVISLRRLVLFLGSLEIIFILASEKDTRKSFFTVMSCYFMTVGILSFLSISFMPSIGIDPTYGNAWRGILFHKNGFGQMAVLGCFFWMFLLTSNQDTKNKWLCLGFFILNLIFLVQSKSATALVVSFLAFSFYFFLLLFRRMGKGIWFFVFSTGIVLFLAVKIYEQLFLTEPVFKIIVAALGKDTTFTGRVYIWNLMLRIVSLHPLFGCGFGAFSLVSENSLSYRLGFAAAHFHNGYLEILNELGAVGSAIFFLFVADTFLKNARLLKHDYFLGVFWISMIVTVLIFNIVESPLMSSFSIFWYLFCFAGVLSCGSRDKLFSCSKKAHE